MYLYIDIIDYDISSRFGEWLTMYKPDNVTNTQVKIIRFVIDQSLPLLNKTIYVVKDKINKVVITNYVGTFTKK